MEPNSPSVNRFITIDYDNILSNYVNMKRANPRVNRYASDCQQRSTPNSIKFSIFFFQLIKSYIDYANEREWKKRSSFVHLRICQD